MFIVRQFCATLRIPLKEITPKKTYYCGIHYTQYIILSSQPLKIISTILQTRKLGPGGKGQEFIQDAKDCKIVTGTFDQATGTQCTMHASF